MKGARVWGWGDDLELAGGECLDVYKQTLEKYDGRVFHCDRW